MQCEAEHPCASELTSNRELNAMRKKQLVHNSWLTTVLRVCPSTCNLHQPESNNAPKRGNGPSTSAHLRGSRQWRQFVLRLLGCSRYCRCCGQKMCHFDHFLPGELRASSQQSDPDSLKSQPGSSLAGLGRPIITAGPGSLQVRKARNAFSLENPLGAPIHPQLLLCLDSAARHEGEPCYYQMTLPHRLAKFLTPLCSFLQTATLGCFGAEFFRCAAFAGNTLLLVVP